MTRANGPGRIARGMTFVSAVGVTLIVRCALLLVPYRILRGWMPVRARSGEIGNLLVAQRIVRDVERAARLVPRSTCLTRALAAQWLLALAGHGSSLHVGVVRHPGRPLEAHAWLESRGQVVLGGDPAALSRFAPIYEWTVESS